MHELCHFMHTRVTGHRGVVLKSGMKSKRCNDGYEFWIFVKGAKHKRFNMKIFMNYV